MEGNIENPRIKVSFDFDGTLEFESVQEYARELIKNEAIEVWIVTSRFDNNEMYQKFFQTEVNVEIVNEEIWKIANLLGIPKERVHFTNYVNKFEFFKDSDFLWHLDDDSMEEKLININTKTKCVSYWGNPKWKVQCQRILNKKLKSNLVALFI